MLIIKKLSLRVSIDKEIIRDDHWTIQLFVDDLLIMINNDDIITEEFQLILKQRIKVRSDVFNHEPHPRETNYYWSLYIITLDCLIIKQSIVVFYCLDK